MISRVHALPNNRDHMACSCLGGLPMTPDLTAVVAKLVRNKIAIRAIGPGRTLEQDLHMRDVASTAIVEAISMLHEIQQAKADKILDGIKP